MQSSLLLHNLVNHANPCFNISAKARLSKKAKTSAPTGEVEPEKAPENPDKNLDNLMDDYVPPEPTNNADLPEADLATHEDTSSPHAITASPVADPLRSTANPPSPAKDDDVIVTGTAYTAPGDPVILAKHIAKDEFTSMGKRKMEADLSKYANLSAQDLHSGFLNRLYTSRDNEADLVNLMKERYEVNIFLLIFVF